MTKWVTKKLGEGGFVDFVKGEQINGELLSAQGQFPMFNGGIEPSGYLDKYNTDANQIIMSEGGNSCGYINYIEEKFWRGGHCYLVKFKDETAIEKQFFYYLLKYHEENLMKLRVGSGLPNIQKKDVFKYTITYPESLTEQRRIAGILSSADGAIAASEALIEKYRNIKRGLLATLLQPKEGWKKVKLGECLKQKPDYGINAPAVAYDNKFPTYLRITDITEDGYYSKNDVVSVADPDAYKYKMEEGDLVFARTGASVGKTYLYNPQDGILVFAGFLIRVKTDEDILLSSFFKYQTQTQQYKNWIANNSMRTGQPGINGNEYETFSFYLPYKNGQPDLAEQRRIADILSSVDAKIAAEEKVVEKYKGVKKGLMEELFDTKN